MTGSGAPSAHAKVHYHAPFFVSGAPFLSELKWVGKMARAAVARHFSESAAPLIFCLWGARRFSVSGTPFFTYTVGEIGKFSSQAYTVYCLTKGALISV